MRKSRWALSLSRGSFFSRDTPLVAHWRSPLGPTAEVGALGLVDGVRLGGVVVRGGALGLVRLPATAVGAPGPGVLVELEHVGHGAIEEGPVVRDDHHAAAAPFDHLLEAGEAVEVEVVRRLVEQGDVEAGEEDGSQRDAGLLPARERVDRLAAGAGWESHLARGW